MLKLQKNWVDRITSKCDIKRFIPPTLKYLCVHNSQNIFRVLREDTVTSLKDIFLELRFDEFFAGASVSI